jgi:hypothetical protein
VTKHTAFWCIQIDQGFRALMLQCFRASGLHGSMPHPVYSTFNPLCQLGPESTGRKRQIEDFKCTKM